SPVFRRQVSPPGATRPLVNMTDPQPPRPPIPQDAAAAPSQSAVTRLLDAAGAGDPSAAGALLPLVYQELRRLARARLRGGAEQTLQPTALVHEAYLRLVGAGR